MKCSSRVLAALHFFGRAGVLRCLALALAGVAGFPLTGWAAPGPTVSTVYASPGYLIPGDATRGFIAATANFTVESAAAGNRTLRVDFQLVDAAGTAVFIETPTQSQKNTTTVSVELTQNFAKGNQTVSVPVELVPDVRLDPSKTYQVRLWRVVELNTDDFVPPNLGIAQTDGAANRFVHFFGGNGVVARMASASFSKSFRIRTGAGAASAFQVTPLLDFYRYDPGALSVAPEVELTCVMRDGTGTVVPLQESVFTVNKTTAMGGGAAGSPVADGNAGIAGTTLNLRPVAGLDSVVGTYTVTVTARFIPRDGVSAVTVQNGVATAGTGVLDFNGTIRFNTVNTTFTAINNSPLRGAVSAGRIGTSLGVAFQNGRIAGIGDSHTFGTGVNLPVQVDAAGVAYYNGFLNVSVAGPGTDSGSAGGVVFRRQSISLNMAGVFAGTMRVFLPGGLGYLPDLTTRRATANFDVGGVPLDQDLNPTADLPLAGVGWLHEESKPFVYQIQSLTWESASGRMVADAGLVRSLRNEAVTELAAVKPNLMNPESAVKASNDHVFNGVDSATTPLVVTVDGDGNARVDVSITLGANSFFPHMPYADPGDLSQDIASTGGQLHLVEDLPANASKLAGVAGFALKYDRACVEKPGEESGCALASDMTAAGFLPTGGELFFTPDGGLQGVGGLLGGAHKLRWGKDPTDLAYAHVVDTGFATAGYLMAGSSLPGGLEGTQSKAVEAGQWMGVGAILGSGVNPGQTGVVRPGTVEYWEADDEFADYPGLNFRVNAHGAPMSAKSRVAGVETPDYALAERSHYYVRRSGVSGIHQAVEFDENLPLYGYDVKLTRFQLSFLSNLNEDSRSDGSLSIPAPAEFQLPFSKLLLSCPGAVKDVVMDGVAAVQLKYWDNAPLQVLAARFETADGCDPAADACLVLGVTARAQLFNEPLAGELGFRSNGQIATRSNGNPAVDSRLRMPAVRLPGPGRKTYAFTPAQDAYFNDQASAGGAAPGYLNLFGTVSAPFFQDMKWHVQTKAKAPTEQPAPDLLYAVAGGWESGGTTAFGQAFFDPSNRGLPPAVTAAAYRAASAEGNANYSVKARQDWLGIPNAFDYSLKWSAAGRSFGAESVTRDFFVFNLTHQVKSLTPDTAEITFGLDYDGLPRINLAGLASSALDSGVGYTRSLVRAMGEEAADQLLGGIDAGRSLVDSRLDALISPVLDGAVMTQVDQFLEDLYNLPDAVTVGADFSTQVDVLITQRFEAPNSPFSQAMSLSFNGSVNTGGALNVAKAVDLRLAQLQMALSAVSGNSTGLLDPEGVKRLIRSLVADQAPEFVGLVAAEFGGEAIAGAGNELLNSEALQEIRASVARVNTRIGEARQRLGNATNGLPAQLGVAFSASLPDIRENLAQAIEVELLRYQTRIEAGASVTIPLAEIPRVQLREIIRQRILDEVLGSQVLDPLQTQLREYAQDSVAAVTTALDNGLQEVNTAMRTLIATQLASVDDSINQQVLGPMSDLIGAGRLSGYAHINGNSLTELRVDGAFRWKVPEAMEFSGFLLIKQMNSDNRGGCYGPGETANEITIGANKVPLKWISPGLKADVAVKFTVSDFVPEGMGGSFKMVGDLTYEAFKIQEMAAAVSFGRRENYLAAGVGMEFGDYAMAGGVFFGRTCTLDPIILIDPEVAGVLGTPPFTGAYVYGEARIPVNELIGIPSSCMLKLRLGAGAGVFYFAEGPTYGGKLVGEASGEALCLISIGGRMSLVGVKQGSGGSAPMRFNGNGRLTGKVGVCRLCKRFNKSVGVSFNVTNGRISSPSIRY